MRLWTIFAFVVAGSVYAVEAARPIRVDAGENFQTSVLTLSQTVTRCYLTTPQGAIIEFIPDSNQNDKYRFTDVVQFSDCAVIIKNADSEDNGLWVLTSDFGETSESESFDVTVIPREDAEEEAKEDDNINWLTPINYVTRIGLEISVTLSKQTHSEECNLRTPEGNTLKQSTEGVNFYDSSDFVSCRVVIGPMDQTLLGKWALCGKYTENNVEHERCQTANINWNNNNTDIIWHSEERPVFDHVVNFDGTLTPAVTGTGTVNTCHIITPNGEDLVITPESDYPHIRRAENDVSVCSVAIGPIEASLLGNWVIYGTFNSVAMGFNEVRLPMNLHIYDENNPYNKAYNVTTLAKAQYVVNLGNTIEVQVLKGSGSIDGCYYKTPAGDTYDQIAAKNANAVSFVDVGSSVACRLSVGPISEEMLGEWELTGKFSNNGVYTEIKQTFIITREDPENPLDDPNRTVVNLPEEFINTRIGDLHRVALNIDFMNTHETCHIKTPAGLQYQIMDGFNITGLSVVEVSSAACVVSVAVSEDLIGEWTLISREIRMGTSLERRLPFTIYVEERVNALPAEASVAEGNDLYIRLENSANLPSTCKLVPPTENERFFFELDYNYKDTCGFIVKNVPANAEGKWEIVYGNKIIYKATTMVTVTERWSKEETTLFWIKDRPVQEVMGPEDAVYCRIEDPSGLTVFEGFERCHIDLERVRLDHHGHWTMTVGSPGRVLTDQHKFLVNVKNAEQKYVVKTTVEQKKPSVMLRCSVPQSNVTACKFRKPDGQVLLATHGVGEDRYSFHGVGFSLQSELQTHECGLRITNPVVADLGLWRCALDTESETYYGFLSVMCPWAIKDPEVAAVVEAEPILRAGASFVEIVDDESLTMSCSVQSAIDYCYFRAQNGTVYNVSPRSTSPSYVGAGLDAGECGIRFSNLVASDTGTWSCHVGFPDSQEAPEQRAKIEVYVEEALKISAAGSWPGPIIFEAVVPGNRVLEYCRFIRIDGFGFTSHTYPSGYIVSSPGFDERRCELSVANPTMLDAHPWTVVAKVMGQDVEIARVTPNFFGNPPSGPARSNFALVWTIILLITLTMFVIGMMLGTTKNRKWTARRAASVRSSFRRFQSKPVLPVVNEKSTAIVA